MNFDDIMNNFMKKNNIKNTFYNKFLNAYTFCFTYKYMYKQKNVSFIVMEKEGKIICIQKFSLVKERVKEVFSLEELDRYYKNFMQIAGNNQNLTLCEA